MNFTLEYMFLGVFILTATSSLFAYLWLLIVLLWSSPNIVEPWEAIVTLLFFPALVLSAYATDNGFWMDKWNRSRAVGDVNIAPKQDEPVILAVSSNNAILFRLLITGA